MKHVQIYEKFIIESNDEDSDKKLKKKAKEAEKLKKRAQKDSDWANRNLENPTKLKKLLDVSEDEIIPMDKISDKIDELHGKLDNDGKLSKKDKKILRRLNLIKKLKSNLG
ncbi:hypothetical protein M0Q97_05785 [Candidatus Dojkabacteria bacterium]|jgi:hypothetical protein|nr:hypothetical protein [Candidatus Dojkabacteria bacterium]